MPKLPPHELYAIKLSHLNLGYALFEPDPNGAYDHVRVGDVGYISDDGKFIKIFNAFHAVNSPENSNSEFPGAFEPIAQKYQKIDKLGSLSPGLRLSESVRTVGGNLSVSGPILQVAAGASVRLSCTTRCGAALITKELATRNKALSSKAMEEYMIQNCISWLKLARELGRPVEMHDLIFVRECILTGDWASITWDKSSCGSQISFSAGIDGVARAELSYWGQWEDHIDVPRRQGPLRIGPGHESYHLSNFDQCIFLKGIRIAQREWYKKIRSLLKVKATDDSEIDRSSSGLSTAQLFRKQGFKLETIGSTKSTSFRPVQNAYDIVALLIFDGSSADVAIIDDKDLYALQISPVGDLEEIYDALLNHQELAINVSVVSELDRKLYHVGRVCLDAIKPPLDKSMQDLIVLDENYEPVNSDFDPTDKLPTISPQTHLPPKEYTSVYNGRLHSLSDQSLTPEDEAPYERDSPLQREEVARQVSDQMDYMIRQEKEELKQQKNIKKILLLGQSESGKSTTLKQFQLLHTPVAFHQEKFAWRGVIYINLIRSVLRILDVLQSLDSEPPYHSASQPGNDGYVKRLSPLFTLQQRLIHQLDFPVEDGDSVPGELSLSFSLPSHIGLPIPFSQTPDTKRGEVATRPSSNWMKSFSFLSGNASKSAHTGKSHGWWEDPHDPMHILNACAFGDYGMHALWRDSEVRDTLARRRILMEESAGFYLNDIERITSLGYIPTDDDVLRARLKTIGVVEHTFLVKGGDVTSKESVEWRIYDVGGARQQRQEWAPYFTDINAIIFLAPISAFDQILVEDPCVNRLEDSILLWRSVISNKLLADTSIILFLNKCDLLKAKLDAGVALAYHMPSYRGRPNDYESVSKYFRSKFASLHHSHTPNQQRELYIHLTTVTDKLKTSVIISSVEDVILNQNLQYSHIL